MSKKGRRLREDTPEEKQVWIRTEPRLDGSGYDVTIAASEDRAVVLTPDVALRYASAILGAVARAGYDAAVVTQLTNLVIDERAAVQVVMDLRGDRPPLDHEATVPLRLEPGVNAQHKPFLTVLVDDEPVGQWTLPDAREHALTVLEAVTVADLDSGYLRALKGTIGLDENRAHQVVDDLGKWRKE